MRKALLILLMIGMALTVAACQNDGGYWRCTQVNPDTAKCVESQDGFAWAKQYCQFNGSATVCPIFDQQANQEYQVPVELINLSAVNRCLRMTATCIEETYVKNVSYEVNISQMPQTS